MRNWRRLLCLWLIAIALPLQGAAAGALGLCGPLHGATLSAPVGGAADHDEAHAHVGHTHADEAHAHHAPAPEAGDAEAAGAGCSLCGACCAAAILPPAAGRLPDAAPAPGERPLRGWLAALHFLTDGPERPPRTALA